MTSEEQSFDDLIVPIGTQIVLRKQPSDNLTERPGAVAEIIAYPSGAQQVYRVRFVDGSQTSLQRSQFSILKQVKAGPIADSAASHSEQNDQIELDLVTHDVLKFFKMLLRPNGYVLEQLLSPLVVHKTPEYEELKYLVPGCLTRNHVHHYLGFAQSQWDLFQKEAEPRIKPLLYTFRVLLTGIHLMRSGEIEANLGVLNTIYGLPFIPELMARKREGNEQETLDPSYKDYYEREFCALRARLVEEGAITSLPASPTAQEALNDIVIRVRLDSLSGRAKD